MEHAEGHFVPVDLIQERQRIVSNLGISEEEKWTGLALNYLGQIVFNSDSGGAGYISSGCGFGFSS